MRVCARAREREKKKEQPGSERIGYDSCRGVARMYVYCYEYVNDVCARDSSQRAGMTERRFFLPRGSLIRAGVASFATTTTCCGSDSAPRYASPLLRLACSAIRLVAVEENTSCIVEPIYQHPRLSALAVAV